jgi:hypothetical protein
MPVPVPTPTTRWRCALCGNLTRFDVERSTRAREYVHVSLAGEAAVEERVVVAETVDHVTCRWCGRLDSVELVPRPGEPGAPEVTDPDPAAVDPAVADPAPGAELEGPAERPAGT